MRGWRQKLHSHARAAVAGVSEVDNPALLLFLRNRIHENQYFAIIDLVAKIQQPAVSIHDQGFADFPELAPFVTAPLGLQTHLTKHALAAAVRGLSEINHGAMFAWGIS